MGYLENLGKPSLLQSQWSDPYEGNCHFTQVVMGSFPHTLHGDK